ncbi:hypothetical protein JHK82_037987 [Glycine max]|uniref:Uncharacterized protein n=1 Tax=Glycine max TaxID=3847 RepID=K7M3A0_SOYBN|nr:hypothetical protein JHK85_038739 [Glycine max]KAG5114718.1 hypothetical protein JHK82_037987 [Glycine max]KAH1104602.1 hypothetical protein GYH30_038132 [Glycine max]
MFLVVLIFLRLACSFTFKHYAYCVLLVHVRETISLSHYKIPSTIFFLRHLQCERYQSLAKWQRQKLV